MEDSGRDQPVTVERLVGMFAEDPRKAALGAFARAYLQRLPATYVNARPIEETAAHVRSVFEFADERRGNAISVRVFNPTRSSHGYEAPVSVLEVASSDMAFLVDSITNEIQAQGHTIVQLIHPVVGTVRDGSGRISAVVPARTAPSTESIQHFELSRLLDDDEARRLQQGVERALLDVRRAVSDFEPMQGAIYRMIQIARAGIGRYGKDDVDEAVSFLEWLLDLNFVFLGYREYEITQDEAEPMLSVVMHSGLGILRDDAQSAYAEPVAFSSLRPSLRARYERGELLVITKTNSTSRVHRRARMDYIGVRHIGPDGSVVGEVRLLGLFTSKAYMAPADSIPVLRRKLRHIIETEDLIEGSHSYKEVVQLFNSFPTDELFATPTDAVRESIVGLIEVEERQQIKLFMRRDLLQRNVSLLVVMPRDRFNAELRVTLQQLFVERFGGNAVDYRLALGETDTARLHFTLWAPSGQLADVSPGALEAEVVAAAQTWEERLAEKLTERFGLDRGNALLEEWARQFPSYYRASTPLEVTVGDIEKLHEMVQLPDQRLVVGLQLERSDGEELTRLAVYRAGGKLELSSIMPTLEALGLRVVEEVPTRLSGGAGEVFIHDFGVLDGDGKTLELEDTGGRVADTIVAVLSGRAESDSLNRLVVSSGLDHEQVRILRAYRTYWRRVSPGFTVEYINDAFSRHPEIAADLVDVFQTRFDPGAADADMAPIVERIHARLDRVASLDEDRILRGFLGLILATQRTNAYSGPAERLAFKFRSVEVPAMPRPAPLYEIFVYATDVEGIHLRSGMVARGGIRWSTRKEDYRTEVLGLMKAQVTKNAVIVPTGAKGGFVLRHPPGDESGLGDAVRSGYETFIRGLLDLTDNLIEGKVVPPERVRVHDGDDPYLVVAADKGTATFSDVANELAAEYGFWLGDAFASGGSAGYDHKALGITARGAWESVKWHFRELGIEIMDTPFTVVGIGDMSGDVFGNGMLLSKTIRLVAAFDHRHIFIDPDPDPAISFEERQRLFTLPRSSWGDYDKSLLSPGGGVYPRTAKRVDLTKAARRAIGLGNQEVTPDEVIKAILRAPVDLLWNGGIGTYVKAEHETNQEVGDRVNDSVRIDGRELRCKVIGEGGNLGLTQSARIEYALGGGRVNTDFIDNAAGVHCSDREVNLKVLLGLAESHGALTREERNRLVGDVADDVVDAILYDDFLQAQILAQDVERSALHMDAYEELMALLESEGTLDRTIEYLPVTDEMNERARSGLGMTAPEMSVLLAYAKRSLRSWLLESDLPDWPDFAQVIHEYFPAAVVERFGHLIPDHPLRRQLIATIIANRVVNSGGVTFVTRLMNETGATADLVVRAYHIARAVVDATERWRAVESLIGQIPTDLARQLMRGIDDLVESVARWYLTNPGTDVTGVVIEKAKPAFEELTATIAEIGPPQWIAEREDRVAGWISQGVPAAVAHRHVYQEELIHGTDIIEVAQHTSRPVRDVAEVFLLVGWAFEIEWIETQVANLPIGTRWQRLARQAVEDDLVLLRRQVAECVLAAAGDNEPQTALRDYLAARRREISRLDVFLRSLAGDGVTDVGTVIVAIRQIRNLAT